jgi:plastocyanin
MISKSHVVAAAFVLAITGCGITGPAHREPPPPAVDQTVTMGFTDFRPATVRIRTGQTVQWRNTSPIGHTVTADPSHVKNPANVALPDGAEPFHSGNIAAGEVWQRTFTIPGTYRYVCLPHEQQGMIGTVIVDPK